jgi:hypothetical protein
MERRRNNNDHKVGKVIIWCNNEETKERKEAVMERRRNNNNHKVSKVIKKKKK